MLQLMSQPTTLLMLLPTFLLMLLRMSQLMPLNSPKRMVFPMSHMRPTSMAKRMPLTMLTEVLMLPEIPASIAKRPTTPGEVSSQYSLTSEDNDGAEILSFI